jgi:hypothetical protein
MTRASARSARASRDSAASGSAENLEFTAAIATLPRITLAESALHAPFTSFGGTDAYPILVEQAAVLLQHLAKNHPAARRRQARGIPAHGALRRRQRPSVETAACRCRRRNGRARRRRRSQPRRRRHVDPRTHTTKRGRDVRHPLKRLRKYANSEHLRRARSLRNPLVFQGFRRDRRPGRND